MGRSQRGRTDLKARIARARLWVRGHIRPGWRAVVGVLLICGGLLGFLPVLGFWMIPLGIAIAALDLRPAWRRWRGRR